MDGSLLADSDADTLEKAFDEVKRILLVWRLQIASEIIQREILLSRIIYRFTDTLITENTNQER